LRYGAFQMTFRCPSDRDKVGFLLAGTMKALRGLPRIRAGSVSGTHLTRGGYAGISVQVGGIADPDYRGLKSSRRALTCLSQVPYLPDVGTFIFAGSHHT
jgi:hypothetical protein